MKTDEGSLNHATCTNELIPSSPTLMETKISFQIAPLAFSIFDRFSSVHFFPSLPIPILLMTCAAKRGSQLSNALSSAIRTPVFCSARNSESSALSFHFSHTHYNTTVGHVITLRCSLRNYVHSHTCLNHCILECFRTRFNYRISK